MPSSADLSLRGYAEELASLAPTPDAVAIPAVLAASLAARAARQTAASDPFAAVAEEMEAVAAEADELRAELLALVAEDERSFEQAMAARRAGRSGEVPSAYREAEAALSRRVLELAAEVAERGHPFARADAAAAVAFASASLESAGLEVPSPPALSGA